MKTIKAVIIGFGLIPFALTLASAWADAGADGPFGLTMGQPFESLQIKQDLGNAQYSIGAVPNPHSFLDMYSVIATPEDGLCQVSGYLTLTEETSRVNLVFVTLSSQLDAKYGERKRLPVNNEPTAVSKWVWVGTSEMRLRKIAAIFLTLHQEPGGQARAILIQFDFDNKDDCLTAKGTENPL